MTETSRCPSVYTRRWGVSTPNGLEPRYEHYRCTLDAGHAATFHEHEDRKWTARSMNAVETALWTSSDGYPNGTGGDWPPPPEWHYAPDPERNTVSKKSNKAQDAPTEYISKESYDGMFDKADTIAQVVGEAVGFGSYCWEDMSGTGVFQSDIASRAVDEAVKRIEQLTSVGLKPSQQRRVEVLKEAREVLAARSLIGAAAADPDALLRVADYILEGS